MFYHSSSKLSRGQDFGRFTPGQTNTCYSSTHSRIPFKMVVLHTVLHTCDFLEGKGADDTLKEKQKRLQIDPFGSSPAHICITDVSQVQHL